MACNAQNSIGSAFTIECDTPWLCPVAVGIAIQNADTGSGVCIEVDQGPTEVLHVINVTLLPHI